jgi:hypothetical protein
MKLGHKDHLNTKNKFLKEFFSNPKILLVILDELNEQGFRGTGRNSPNRRV